MKEKQICVESIEHLKQLSGINGFAEFYIIIAGGFAKSSKRIRYYSDRKTFDVHNEIDDTWQEELTEDSLYTETNIMEAIEKNALVYTGSQL